MSDDDDQKFENAVKSLPSGDKIFKEIEQALNNLKVNRLMVTLVGKQIQEHKKSDLGKYFVLTVFLLEKLKYVICNQYTLFKKAEAKCARATAKLTELQLRQTLFKGGNSTSPSDIIYKGKKAIRQRFFMTKEEKEELTQLEGKRADLRRAKNEEIDQAREAAFPKGYYSTSPVIKRFMRKVNHKAPFSKSKLNREAFRRKLRENDWDAVKHRFELTPSSLP